MEKLQNGEVILNRWVVDNYIGSGRYGMVYKAHDNSGIEAAVKVISLPTESQINDFETLIGGGEEAMESFFDEMANRFVAEVESLKRIGSDNAIKYIDHAASKRGLQWDIIIVMEYAYTIKDYMATNPLTYADIANMGIGIASVLERCAELKIMHRDIKEDNMFVGKDGKFKIGDFGTANISATGSQGIMTKGIGSPYYMAPEVETSENYTGSVDIYSLGIVLYRLLNYKRFPFMPHSDQKISQDDNARAFGERRSGKPLPPPEFCPQPLIPVILKACEYYPQNRYATAAEFKEAFIQAMQCMSSDELSSLVPLPESRGRGVTPTPAPVNNPINDVPINNGPINNGPINNGPMNNNFMNNSSMNDNSAPAGSTVDVINRGEGTKTMPIHVLNRDGVQDGAQSSVPPADNMNSGMGSAQPLNTGEGMKTTDAIKELMKKFGRDSTPVSKMIEKVQALDKANGEIKKQQRELKKKKRNIIIISSIAAVLLIALALSALFGIDYRNNKKAGDQLYMYFLGFPVKNICPDEEISACYVVTDNNWIYFSWHNKPWGDPEDLQMYRIDKKGGNLTRISTDSSEYLVCYEDYIYYINTTDINNPTLCRVPVDAEDMEGEALYNDKTLPIDCDYGIRLNKNLIGFRVYDENNEYHYKYFDFENEKFYDKK